MTMLLRVRMKLHEAQSSSSLLLTVLLLCSE